MSDAAATAAAEAGQAAYLAVAAHNPSTGRTDAVNNLVWKWKQVKRFRYSC